jgi:CubicO group peptidase (beta-lactamase class C family)
MPSIARSDEELTRCHGFVARGFEPVRDAFIDSLRSGEETGGAFAAAVAGEVIVDVWGGSRDAEGRLPWRQDTLCNIFSGSKGLVATCVLVLIDRGELSLDDEVCRYWPEFAAKDKRGVLVKHVVSHQAGLPGIRDRIRVEEVPDTRRLAAVLAAQELFWPAGSMLCYSPLTFGWICGELVRRITGSTIGDFFRTEIAEPLGLEVWIGLPPRLEPRVATCFLDERWEGIPVGDPAGEIGVGDVADIWLNPDLFPRDLPWNRPIWRTAEIPGAGAIATARAMAAHYATLAGGGSPGGASILSPAAIALGQEPLAHGVDPCDGEDIKVGVGWILQTAQHRLGPARRAFGHGGAGGSLHGAWPEEEVGFSYLTNRLRDDEDDDRAPQLLRTLHACLD